MLTEVKEVQGIVCKSMFSNNREGKWMESLGKGAIIDRHKGDNKDSQDRKKRGKMVIIKLKCDTSQDDRKFLEGNAKSPFEEISLA